VRRLSGFYAKQINRNVKALTSLTGILQSLGFEGLAG